MIDQSLRHRGVAQAIHTALTMPATEKGARMRRMRTAVKEHNVYRWAGDLIGELAGIRLEAPSKPAARERRRAEVGAD